MTPRHWSIASLISGFVWFILAIAPTFVTTLIGLPFLPLTMVLGLYSRRKAQQSDDRAAVRLSTISLGLGCAGCAWVTVFYIGATAVVLGLVIGAIVGGVQTWLGIATPTPIPTSLP